MRSNTRFVAFHHRVYCQPSFVSRPEAAVPRGWPSSATPVRCLRWLLQTCWVHVGFPLLPLMLFLSRHVEIYIELIRGVVMKDFIILA